VLCAYIARYSQAMPDSVRTLGDCETGYIITPVTAEMAKAIDAMAVGSS
jgi:predicted RNase H-like nuclease